MTGLLNLTFIQWVLFVSLFLYFFELLLFKALQNQLKDQRSLKNEGGVLDQLIDSDGDSLVSVINKIQPKQLAIYSMLYFGFLLLAKYITGLLYVIILLQLISIALDLMLIRKLSVCIKKDDF